MPAQQSRLHRWLSWAVYADAVGRLDIAEALQAEGAPMSDYYWEARCHAAETECVKLHEQISFLESREVCAAAHDNVETCGYCQRDEQAKRIEMLEAENNRLRAQSRSANDYHVKILGDLDGWQNRAIAAESRIEQLEAGLLDCCDRMDRARSVLIHGQEDVRHWLMLDTAQPRAALAKVKP